MLRRVSRVALALSCPLLGVATLAGLSAVWTIPLLAVCMVNTVILIAEQTLARAADDTVVLNLHR